MLQGVIVLGTGGHAKVLAEVLGLMGIEIRAAATGEHTTAGGAVLNVPLLTDDAVRALDPGETVLVNGVGSLGTSARRRSLFDSFRALGFSFMTVRHPASVVSDAIAMGEGVQVMAGAVVQPGSSIGDNTIVNTSVSVDHDCLIGAHVHLAPGVTLSGGVTVGDGSHIGTGASVIQGIRIGRGSVVGAGAVVIGDVQDDTTVAGVPASPLAP